MFFLFHALFNPIIWHIIGYGVKINTYFVIKEVDYMWANCHQNNKNVVHLIIVVNTEVSPSCRVL
jgi:hypothetical protein